MSVRRKTMHAMMRFDGQDLTGAEFRECDLNGARLIGVVMQDAVIDGLVNNLVVNGVEVSSYVADEMDRRHPVRLLTRSGEPVELREAHRRLRATGRRLSSGCVSGTMVPNTCAWVANGRQ